jgi:hypothetical protein
MASASNQTPKRRDEPKQHLDRDFFDGREQAHEDVCEHVARDDSTHAGQEQHRQDAPTAERARDRGTHRGAVDQQRRGIVKQALAFEDHQQPMRR